MHAPQKKIGCLDNGIRQAEIEYIQWCMHAPQKKGLVVLTTEWLPWL